MNRRQKITRQVENTCAGCCTTACTVRVDAAQNWEEELYIDTQRSQLDERDRVPMRCSKVASRVNISWQPCTRTTSRLVESDTGDR